MKQCEKCIFYDNGKDELQRQFNDCSEEDFHYCIMYDDHIPIKISNDESECGQYVENQK